MAVGSLLCERGLLCLTYPAVTVIHHDYIYRRDTPSLFLSRQGKQESQARGRSAGACLSQVGPHVALGCGLHGQRRAQPGGCDVVAQLAELSLGSAHGLRLVKNGQTC